MRPILFYYKIPESFKALVGPKSWFGENWKIFAMLFAIAFVIFLFQGEGKDGKVKPKVFWPSLGFSLLFGLPLFGWFIAGVGHIKLYSYGMLIALGFLTAIFMTTRRAKKVGIDPNKINDLAFWVLFSGVIGSRVLDMIVTWRSYWIDMQRDIPWTQWRIMRPWDGGLVFYGGFLGAIIFLIYFTRKHKIHFWKLTDVLIPSLALAHFFGRLGCLAAGCCHGKACNLPWAITFPKGVGGIAPTGISLHPTQIYSMIGLLGLFFILLFIRSRKKFHGQVFASYLLIYPFIRFTVEFFRGDSERGFLFKYDLITKTTFDGLTWLPNSVYKILQEIASNSTGPDLYTTSQAVSTGLFAIGLTLFLTLRKKTDEVSTSQESTEKKEPNKKNQAKEVTASKETEEKAEQTEEKAEQKEKTKPKQQQPQRKKKRKKKGRKR